MTWSRDQLAARFREDRDTWRSLVAQVDRERMEERGPMGEWTFKDLVSHLDAWRHRTLARLEAAAAGKPRPANPWPAGMSEDDPINDWFRERDASRPVDDLLADYDGTFDRMTAAVTALPESANPTESDTPGYFRWHDAEGPLESDFFNHLEVHADDLRAWLAKG